jgi:tetratricopeptide (TPR) repeat protein
MPRSRAAKAGVCAAISIGLAAGTAQDTRPTGAAALRSEIARWLQAGEPEQAVRRAQQALREAPADAEVRREYIELHLSLARTWILQRRLDAAGVALNAVRAIDPGNEDVRRLVQEMDQARARAAAQAGEIGKLLGIERFEDALDAIREVKVVRPDLADSLTAAERAAWLGAADVHYLARNFNEAFALYENLLAIAPDCPPSVHSRWVISLALALAESDFSGADDSKAGGRLLARAIDVLRKTNEPIVGQIVGGLLAERAGQWIDAGRAYCEALGEPWTLPPAPQRRERAAALRARVTEKLRNLYSATPTQRREGSWAVALPDAWKQRQTPHFDIYARNDWVAERVAEALEFHLAGIASWLGRAPAERWEPPCEVRVHATQGDLHAATGTSGITYAVSHTRVQGDTVLTRRIEAFQGDPWLLSSTLPHELTHVVVADLYRRSRTPLAIEEGVALLAEPSARRLMYQRLLGARPPTVAALLSIEHSPADTESFYAEAGALTSWLLEQVGRAGRPDGASAVGAVLQMFENPPPGEERSEAGVARALGWADTETMEANWRAWRLASRNPPRMPLMILVEPTAESGKKGE